VLRVFAFLSASKRVVSLDDGVFPDLPVLINPLSVLKEIPDIYKTISFAKKTYHPRNNICTRFHFF
jgi:hypothetical protein